MKTAFVILSLVFLAAGHAAEVSLYRAEESPAPGLHKVTVKVKSRIDTYYIGSIPEMSISDFSNARLEGEKLTLKLTESARGKFKKLTKERSQQGDGGHIAILVDGDIVSAPVVRQEIDTEYIEVSGIPKEKIGTIISAINDPKNGG